MEWRSAVSEKPQAAEALKDCRERLGRAEPDLAFLFASPHHSESYKSLPGQVKKLLGPKNLLGCSAGGVIAGGVELEQKTALGLICGWLPDVQVHPFRLEQSRMPGGDAAPKAWRQWIGAEPSPKAAFVLLSDPFTLDPEELARGLDYAYPGSVKVGGLASGAGQPGGNAIFFQDRCFDDGGAGVRLEGDIAIDPIVAQGCRPIGRPLQVTKSHQNLLIELDGKPALSVLEGLVEELDDADRKLAMTSLFVGVLGDSFKAADSRRDYLIRNLVGIDPDKGILGVGAYLRPGQTVQFHLRDGKTSSEDLALQLGRYMEAAPKASARGALLFSCMGRGEGLYGRPNFDSELFFKKLGRVPLGGFFCNGEIGPVDGTTFLHGYTSSFGIIRPA